MKPIDYFIKNNIRIKEIECGDGHVIMMDYDNRIYTFGDNQCGQIGDGKQENVNQPKEIVLFRDRIVEEIKSGTNHVYVKCNENQHWFWGYNKYGQCMVDEQQIVKTPQLFENSKNMKIEYVSLGCDNTKVIVSE